MHQYYFEAAFEVISDLVSIVSDDRSILKVNKAVVEKMGMSDGSLRGHKCYNVFFSKTEPCDDCPFDECKETLKTVTSEIDENYILTVSPIFNSHPEPIGYVHILKDISELKKTEKYLKLGEILIDAGMIDLGQLQLALKIRDKKIGEILIDFGLITDDILSLTLEKQKKLNG